MATWHLLQSAPAGPPQAPSRTRGRPLHNNTEDALQRPWPASPGGAGTPNHRHRLCPANRHAICTACSGVSLWEELPTSWWPAAAPEEPTTYASEGVKQQSILNDECLWPAGSGESSRVHQQCTQSDRAPSTLSGADHRIPTCVLGQQVALHHSVERITPSGHATERN